MNRTLDKNGRSSAVGGGDAGSVAALVSAAALAAAGRRSEGKGALQPSTPTSHWLQRRRGGKSRAAERQAYGGRFRHASRCRLFSGRRPSKPGSAINPPRSFNRIARHRREWPASPPWSTMARHPERSRRAGSSRSRKGRCSSLISPSRSALRAGRWRRQASSGPRASPGKAQRGGVCPGDRHLSSRRSAGARLRMAAP